VNTRNIRAFRWLDYIVKPVDAISGQGVDRKLPTILLLGCLFLASPLRAQTPAPQPPPSVAEENASLKLPPEALNQLLSPIALYPDALVALILPASTVPSDVVLAARYLSSNGDQAQIANQPWDDSVKSLANYPDVLKWMDQNLEWTTQVGDAFLNQPADVMNTIQQLRAQAVAAGNLVDTPQQKIVKEETCIRIVPAEPDVIYVPQYDPEVVYVQPYEPYLGPALTFGIGFAVGSWLNYDCDWPRRKVCVGDWNPRWRDDWNPRWRDEWNPEWRDDWNPRWERNWRRDRGDDYAVVSISTDTARVWEPSKRIRRQHWQRQRNFNNNATAFNSNRRGGDTNDPVRSVARVARPSPPNFNDQSGDGNRRGGRRSNLARNLPGEVRDPGTLPGPLPGQNGQWNRGNVNREAKGKGRGKEQGDVAGNLPGGIRDPGTPPAPQSIQGERWNRGNGNREGKGKGRGKGQSDLAGNLQGGIRDPGTPPAPQSIQGEQWNRGKGNREGKGKGQSDSQSRAMARQYAEPSSIGGKAGKADNFKGRNWRADAGSVQSRKSSPSVTGQSSRSKHSGSVRSNANVSSQKFKTGRSNSSHSGNAAQSFSRPNKHAQAGNKPKGGSQRQVAAAPQQHKAQSAGGGKKGGGGGQKGGKGKDKGKG
jgi:hypothetical protein